MTLLKVIANDLERLLTTTSNHSCKLWGACPFSQLTFSDVHQLTLSKVFHMTWF